VLATIAVKISAAAVIAAAVALSGHLGFLGTTAASTADAGAFGGPVTHVGSIDVDLEPGTSTTLARVSCPAIAPNGTRCYVSTGR